MEYHQILVVAIAVFGSAIIKNSVGVGSGVFLLMFLTMIFPPKVSLGLGAPAMLISDLVGIKNYWNEWDKKELSILLPSALIGVVTGMLFINFVPDSFFKIFIGMAALSFSLYHLVKSKNASNRFTGGLGVQGGDSGKLTVLFGFLGGTASTLVHAGGMVMSIYLVNRHKDQRGFVATLVLFFGIINLCKWIAYTQAGILTWDASIMIWAISPVIILGGVVGNIINRKLRYALFRTIILILILVFGLRLLLTA